MGYQVNEENRAISMNGISIKPRKILRAFNNFWYNYFDNKNVKLKKIEGPVNEGRIVSAIIVNAVMEKDNPTYMNKLIKIMNAVESNRIETDGESITIKK